MFDGQYQCLLPGDTKLSKKWQPSMAWSQDSWKRDQWALPVTQVQAYADFAKCRYGFIITDLHLVVLRFSVEPVSSGLALSRDLRVQRYTHQRLGSGSTDITSSLGAMSLDTTHSSHQNDHLNGDFSEPEYATIRWSSHGEGRLTIKMALFCLGLMASRGESTIETDYPPLDSWRWLDARSLQHTTSGVRIKRPPKGAIVVRPEPAATGPHTDSEDNDNGKEREFDDPTSAEGSGTRPGLEGSDSKDFERDIGEDEAAGPDPVDPTDQTDSRGYTDATDHTESTVHATTAKWHRVDVTKKRSRYVFKDVKGHTRITKKSEWIEISVGWIYKGKKKTYFTEKLE